MGHLHKLDCKRDGNCFFSDISYLATGTEGLYGYIRLNVTQFINCIGTRIRIK